MLLLWSQRKKVLGIKAGIEQVRDQAQIDDC